MYDFFISSCSTLYSPPSKNQRSIANIESKLSCNKAVNLVAKKSKASLYKKIKGNSNFNWKSGLNKVELNIDAILAFRKRNGYNGILHAKYVKSFNQSMQNNKNLFLTKINTSQEKILGEGYSGEVILMKNGDVYKFPLEPQAAISIEVEYAVNRHLYNNFSNFGIKVDRIIERGENGLFLKKELIKNDQMANVILRNSKLSKKQLKKLFKNAKEYARQTGIGLDLKSENLQWDGKDWVLFDTGPRTSYLPYGFTLDIDNFKDYLKIWMNSEPKQTSKNINIGDFTYLLSKNIGFKDLVDLPIDKLIDLLHRKLNDWTGSISRSQIEAIVSSVPSKDRLKALNILKHITGLSDINGLQKFLFSLNKYTGVNTPNEAIYVDNNGGIGSALAYLNKKILPASYERIFEIFSDYKLSNIKENSSILIDQKTDISFLGRNIHTIKKLNLKLVYIHGLEDYISPIDQTSPDNIVRLFSKLYNSEQKQLFEDKAVLDLKKR